MRKRLREVADYSLYDTIYDHTKWDDHRVRVQATVALAAWFPDAQTAADLSCGDGFILKSIQQTANLKEVYFGDFVTNPAYDFSGPIETTIDLIPNVDLFILSETIEHVENPDQLLASIRKKTRYLILTTPDGEWDNRNPEHLWGWDTSEIASMLKTAGFTPNVYSSLSFPIRPYYTFQMWGCT